MASTLRVLSASTTTRVPKGVRKLSSSETRYPNPDREERKLFNKGEIDRVVNPPFCDENIIPTPACFVRRID
jgi:hypothetical protein